MRETRGRTIEKEKDNIGQVMKVSDKLVITTNEKKIFILFTC
jgi:hypothetical protein